MSRKILVTGPPGCGKTTVVRKVAEILGENAAGFYTEEIRDAKKQRIGFRVVTLDGKRGELADKMFVRRVQEILQAGSPFLATIPLRGGGDFLEEIRRQRDAKTFTVTPENRETLPAQIAAMLSALVKEGND